MADEHKVLFGWPHSEPTEVIVAGSFNNWARTCHLIKGSTGFTGSIYVPWGSKITYKYIVDGIWITHPDQPTEPDHDGNINNTYIAPPQPESNGKLAPGETLDTTAGSFPQLVGHLADTLVARQGTSSALGYVVSGFDAALNSVAGIDPINAEQTVIPIPLQTATEFDIPNSAVSNGAPLSSAPIEVPSSPQHPASANAAASEGPKASSASEPPAEVPSYTSVPIVTINVAERNTVPAPAVESIIVTAEKDAQGASREKDEKRERSTHIAIKVRGDTSVVVEDIANKAEENPIPVEPPRVAIVDTPTVGFEPAEKEKVVDGPVSAADEPLQAVSADRATTPEEPSRGVPKALKTPTLSASDLNPSSVLASEEVPTDAVSSATPEDKALTQNIPVVPLQRQLDKLKQTESAPVANEVKAELMPVSAEEPSLEVSDVAAGPAVGETAPEPTVEAEVMTEIEKPALVESAPFAGQVPASETVQKAVENSTEHSVESSSVKQGRMPEAETKSIEPASTQFLAPASEPELVPVSTTKATATEPTLASTVEAAPIEHTAAPATEATPTELSLAPADEVTLAQPLSAPTVAAPTEFVSATVQATPGLVLSLATKAAPAEPALSTTAGRQPLRVRGHRLSAVAPTEPSPESKSESAPVLPASEPAATPVPPSNGHANEATSFPASTASAKAFPSTVSPTTSPSKSEKMVPARKKRSSIFGKIKHFFESDKDKVNK